MRDAGWRVEVITTNEDLYKLKKSVFQLNDGVYILHSKFKIGIDLRFKGDPKVFILWLSADDPTNYEVTQMTGRGARDTKLHDSYLFCMRRPEELGYLTRKVNNVDEAIFKDGNLVLTESSVLAQDAMEASIGKKRMRSQAGIYCTIQDWKLTKEEWKMKKAKNCR